MPIDIKKLNFPSPIDESETNLGKLYIYPLTFRAKEELSLILGGKIEEAEPNAFMRALVRVICILEGSLLEEKIKPEESVLNPNDVDKLSVNDLEDIATKYLAASDFLYRELISKTSPDPTGGTRLSVEKGGIKYPQEENETKVEYLHRLSIIDNQKNKKSLIAMAKKVNSFSKNVTSDILRTLRRGEDFKSTLGTVTPRYEKSHVVDNISKLVHEKEERHLKPIRDLVEKMDTLIDQSKFSSEIMIDNNKVQVEIAEEIKASGDSAGKFSEQNLILTKVVIALTIVSISFSVIVFFAGRNDSKDNALQTKKNIGLVTGAINNLDNHLIESKRGESSNLQKIIEELRLQRVQSEKRIEDLEREVRELKTRKPVAP